MELITIFKCSKGDNFISKAKKMNTNKILPIDLYHVVSAAELIIERALQIFHVSAGQDFKLLPFDPGTLLVICTNGSFTFEVSEEIRTVGAGSIFLAATTDLGGKTSFSNTGFEGTVLYVSEEFLINRQRLTIRTAEPGEIEEAYTCIRLIEEQMKRVRESRAKIVESLLRALLISMQSNIQAGTDDRDIPPLFRQFAMLISRYHHSPVYFYAEKLGITSQELNTQCKVHADMSAAEWISEYVLLEAKDLLLKTRLRPSKIATMLRFSNYDTFSRWFRRHTGDVPGEWR